MIPVNFGPPPTVPDAVDPAHDPAPYVQTLDRPAGFDVRDLLTPPAAKAPTNLGLSAKASARVPVPRLDGTTEAQDPDIKSPAPKITLHGRDYTDVARRLDADPAFRDLRETSSVEALAKLFEDPTLPGTTAKDRLDFAVQYLADPSTHDLPFRVRLPDTGFKPAFQDAALWPISHQGAHFFSAVKLGAESNPILRLGYKWAVIGHEQVGDEKGSAVQILHAAWRGMFTSDSRLFDEAVQAAIKGDYETVRARSQTLVPLPEAPGDWTKKNERVGNSQQDMRLTVYGWALGQLVRTGQITDPADVATWLRHNLAP